MARPQLSSIDHLVLTVRDIERTVQFYGDVLGMQAETFVPLDGSVRTALKFGDQKINLHVHGHEFDPKSHVPQPGSADLCFLTDFTLEAWQAHFRKVGVMIEEGPVRRTGATGPILSVYIRDPDLNLIEIAVGIDPAV